MERSKHLVGLLTGLCAFAFACGSLQAATVSGEIKVDGKRPPKNFVIYLSPAKTGAGKNGTKPVRVSQRNAVFSPSRTVIVVGGVVNFDNDEEQDIDHNVYSLSKGNKFDIGLVSKGISKLVKFKKSGVVKYFCSVHKNMEGRVFVVPSKYYAVLDKPGAFEIDDVPEGDWVVKVSVAHRRYRAKPVNVTVAGEGVGDIVVELSKKRKK